jgi:hypothetical protein
MEKVTLIIKTSYTDDSEASEKKEIKVCQSVEAAKQSVVKELQEGFELPEDCNTYAKIANELANSGIMSRVSGNGDIDTIWWLDNGKGEQFDIIQMDSSEDYYII